MKLTGLREVIRAQQDGVLITRRNLFCVVIKVGDVFRIHGVSKVAGALLDANSMEGIAPG